ncbi:Peptidase S24-like [Thalassobaculum litoreum DSM 18839]|uniref:Peptidase S24-like n=1 Tax=Thalassobaculum litoreum DSM 18839 TaxID=1123362 RepID=A0A8G2BMI6_9PROT|nr:Peptidase S24-like [Thalassobaculum litoreum DSM 18839]
MIEHTESDEVVLIPRYDAALAAGAGSFNERARLLDHIPFTRNFITHKLGRNSADGLVILEARGDSMEPTIGDGDLVLLDQHRREPRDGIVAFALGDTAFIKRLRFTFDGVDLISDNRDLYEPEHLSRQRAEELVIIGRVRWVGRMF